MGPFKAFYFSGVSSVERGIVVERRSILNGPEPDLQEYAIPGRDGAVYFSNNRRKNVEISYETFLRVPRVWNLDPWLTSLKSWLLASPGEYFRLEDDFDPGHYRMAAYIGGLEIDHSWQRLSRQTVPFTCLPYRYLKDGDALIGGRLGLTVTACNPTRFPSLPQIVVVMGASAPSSFRLQIDYEDGTRYVETVTGILPDSYAVLIDSAAQIIRNGSSDGEPMLTTAELEVFPTLKPGVNTITVTGDGLSSVGVYPKWREL